MGGCDLSLAAFGVSSCFHGLELENRMTAATFGVDNIRYSPRKTVAAQLKISSNPSKI